MTNDAQKIVEDILGDFGFDVEDADWEEVEDPHFYVIGLDPGETTGVAIIRIDMEDNEKLPELIFLDQIPEGRYGFKDYFAPFFIGPNTQVVSEKWVEHNKKGVDREPLIIEGVQHALWDDRSVAWQEPKMKALVSDDWLKEQNLWTPGKRHQMDALIHAIVWLRNQSHAGTVNALGGQSNGTMAEPGQAENAQGNGTSPGDGIREALAQMARELAEANANGGGGRGEEAEPGDGYDPQNPKGPRRERDLGGAFIGYVSAEEGEEEINLFEGKL